MVSPVTVESGRGLKFSLFGFPVQIDMSFLLIGLLVGLQVGQISWVVMFLVVVAVSVLVHELGHAFAARALGAKPQIRLHFMGGVTTFAPPRPPTRLQSIGVSLAGPFAGFALGLVVLLARQTVEEPVFGSLSYNAWRFLIFINLGWGLINLAPVLPLDGGHVMANLLPGDESQRLRVASIVSVVVGAGLALLFWRMEWGSGIVVFLFVLFAVQNLGVAAGGSKRANRKFVERDDLESAIGLLNADDPRALPELERLAHDSRDPMVQSYAKMLAVQRHVESGDIQRARRELDELPGQVHPALYGLVSLNEGEPGALRQIDDAVLADPTPAAGHILALGYIRSNRSSELVELLGSGPSDYRAPPMLGVVQHTLHSRGYYDAAVKIGELHIASRPDAAAVVYYNTASGWARLENSERAFARLDEAIDRGWSDLDALDSDPDFAPYRHQVRFGALRGKIH
ncbi:MAG: site-2 protease family protein [Acidimicrobiales bacterium]